MAERALLGAIAAALITALARRLGGLSESGQWAAIACGTCAAAAGWGWAALLMTYFAFASAVTAAGAARKTELTVAATPPTAARTAPQVLANGALFAILALRAGDDFASWWALAAVGALAAASADTWATEVGTLWGGQPRSIINWQAMPRGMSGAVTTIGSAAGVAGAAVVAAAAAGVGALSDRLPDASAFLFVAVGAGFGGMLADSVLGATFQARRWCDTCATWTERRVHPCGFRTVHRHGYRWASNDAVNVAATVTGAAGAVLLGRALL